MIINSNKILMGTIIATNILFVLLSPAFAQINGTTHNVPLPSPQYTDTQGPGVIYRHYSNFSDFTVHHDLTIEDVKAMRIDRINLLESKISSTSYSSFKPPENDSKNILLNMTNLARDQIQNDQLLFAIDTLQSIAAKMDSSVNGSASDDLITDPVAQKKILPLVDDIINATKRAAQPSDSVNREPIPIVPPSPPLMQYVIIGLLIIANAVLGTALVYSQAKGTRI